MVGKVKRKAVKDQEVGAREGLLQELFNDFYKSRTRVYKVNFMRGIWFGVGSVVGGTLVVALAVAILGLLTDIPGGIGEFIQYVVDTVQDSKS